MTLREYLDTRDSATFGRAIRVLNNNTKKNCGDVVKNFSAIVVSTKLTSKFLFIFIDK